MFKRDYFMQQIEQLTVVLHRILFHKEQQQPGKAQELLDEACRHLLGLNPRALASLSSRDILQLLTYNGTVDSGRTVVVAELLMEQGRLDEEGGQDVDAYGLYVKALDVLLELHEAVPQEDAGALRAQTEPHLSKVLGLLERKFVPVPLKRKLVVYFEQMGLYAKAEDVWFLWFEDAEERDGERQRVLEAGAAFYKRLFEKPEEELQAGRFSRAEAQEGLDWCLRCGGQQ